MCGYINYRLPVFIIILPNIYRTIGYKAAAIEKYKALSDRKLRKAKEAMELAKNKITSLQKKLETVKKEEERLRIREKKVVMALQRAREVISSMKKSR